MPNIAEITLFNAVETDDIDALGNILTLDDTDIDINVMIDGETALMKAARLGSVTIAELLLNRDRIKPGLRNADTTLRCEGVNRKTAAQTAESVGFISLKFAIETNNPLAWAHARKECIEYEKRIDDAFRPGR